MADAGLLRTGNIRLAVELLDVLTQNGTYGTTMHNMPLCFTHARNRAVNSGEVAVDEEHS
ncbi:hypothetical protein [Erwinia piriflorinigrans]|uniref:Uncharacterized protein n=1 Tax=Erwinia piriflorinigrans CFBP 5888 TaxID=1161919 RepID=V5Z505_9GAMM|nr:hypothetical protein [Erwinia piriflorinigrans]CCG85986.1 hypothetical protein EPIR_0621 [Erwinia piriflorinigrans CFBP 5888]